MNMANPDRPRGFATRCWAIRAAGASALALALALTLALFAFPDRAQASGSRTISDVYGVDRNELVTWLESHENDSYYIGTPYVPDDCRSPNGDINSWGEDSDGKTPGMNCTGFVWHALCAAHGNRDDIQNRLPALTGWYTAIINNDLENYTFDSKEEMLQSGVLEKGDIIWIWDGRVGALSSFNHIGIFWGDSSSDDRMWHSAGDHLNNWNGINEITDIHGKADAVAYQVVKLGGTLNGGISLSKASALPDVTSGNANYRLDGATYGLFSSEEDAATHDPARAARTFTTNADGSFESDRDIEQGTYFVAETAAPTGYSLDQTVYPVEVKPGETTAVSVTDTPITNPVTLWATKRDAQTADGKAQGSGSLEGARFEISYYDGYYNAGNLPGKATRTWIVSTDAQGKAIVSDGLKVSGGDFYRTASGQVALPLGTVSVREVQAPGGYLIGSRSNGEPAAYVVQITAKDSSETTDAYTAPQFADEVMRGGVAIGKVDRENGQYLPQGSAQLDGAVFSIVTLNEQAVIVDGTTYVSGSVVKTMESVLEDDGSYVARTDNLCLPVGTYEIYETESSDGYLYDDASQAWSQRFQITGEGQVVDLTDVQDAAANQVIRGDIAFSKINGQSGARLGGVPFMMTSQTTGEAHVLVTDENGLISTAADWNSHKAQTNANDEAVQAAEGGYVVAEELLDPSAGVWFNGRVDATCEPDDSLGALPFDTYTVKELRTTANEGLSLASFEVRISRDGRELDLGTVDDNAGPLIGTSLADDNGVKLVPAGTITTITDSVDYANLDPSKRYTLEGSMHLVTAEGEDGGIVAEGSTVFSPRTPTSTVEVDFDVDTSELAGARLVAFERLVDDEGTTVASHEDLLYEGQTVRVPSIGTSIANKADGGKTASAEGTVELVDTVSYQGLTPGDTYTITGTLHLRGEDGKDAGAAVDAEGRPITSQQSFTAPDSTGTVQVTFTFTAPDLDGKTVVAFEELSRRGSVYAVHADINDDGQSIKLTETPSGDHPEPETPEPDEPQAPAAPQEEPERVTKGSLPTTGDTLPLALLVGIAAGATGIAAAALCARSLQRGRDIRINRGPRNR